MRTAAISTTVREDLEAWRTTVPNDGPGGWVFPSEKPNTPIWANKALYDKIRPTLQMAGLGWVNYQVLRRSAVTLLNSLGADGTIVAAQMGHTLDVSTNVYNKVGIQRQQTAIQTLDNTLNQPQQRASSPASRNLTH